MARKKTSNFVPAVDVEKAGISQGDLYADYRTDDGYIKVTRSKFGEKSKQQALVIEMANQEEKLSKLKEKLAGVDKDTIKKIKKKNKKKDKEDNKKKDKKKKKKKQSYDDTLLESVPSDLADFIRSGGKKDKKKDKKKKDKKGKKKKKYDDDTELLGLRVKDKKKKTSDNSEAEKKKKSEVQERFKEVEKITKDNIKTIDDTLKVVDDRIKEITKSSDRVRGRDTALANYIQAKSTLISAKQKAATDILSTRTKVYDIEMRREKNASTEGSSHVEMLAKVFPSVLSNSNMNSAIYGDIAKSGKNKNSKKKKQKKGSKFMDIDRDDELSKREKRLVNDGEIEYNAYDENIELEGKYKIAIKKSWSDGDWKFIATDKHDKIIDIPKKMLPKKSGTHMVFDDEKDVGVDKNTSMVYKVFQVPNL